jgi:hypothetical protein
MDLYKELEFNPFDASRTSNINVSWFLRTYSEWWYWEMYFDSFWII